MPNDLAEYYLRLGDDRLVLGHRLSEWCGHAPVLEEELALGNVALDLLDQASLLLERCGALEGAGRSADDLAFFRDVTEFRNLLLVEQPNGDFASTIARQYLFDVFDLHLAAALQSSADSALASLSARIGKEAAYHVRHSVVVDPQALHGPWREQVLATLAEAGLNAPDGPQPMQSGGRRGRHGEALGRMLSEMQSVARAFPGASW